MVPMRDGKRMATDVYRPKDASKKYPTIFVRTPYNFNFWDVRIGAPRDMPRVRYYTMGINKWQPMNTSNYFEAGHRIRLEVSSSNFPRFDRKLYFMYDTFFVPPLSAGNSTPVRTYALKGGRRSRHQFSKMSTKVNKGQ